MRLLPINPENVKLAEDFMQEYKKKKYGKNVLGVSDEEFYVFIFQGKLGELVFRDFLNQEKVPHECKDILKPYPGRYKREGSDFLLILTGELVDVKTIGNHYKTRLLVREDQFKAKKHDAYVGQRLANEKQLECWGYVTGKELANVPPSRQFGYGPCRHWLLKDLYPIEDFLKKAKRGERI